MPAFVNNGVFFFFLWGDLTRQINSYLSGKLRWQWKMDLLKMYCLLIMGIFHCYVSLPEGNQLERSSISTPTGSCGVCFERRLDSFWAISSALKFCVRETVFKRDLVFCSLQRNRNGYSYITKFDYCLNLIFILLELGEPICFYDSSFGAFGCCFVMWTQNRRIPAPVVRMPGKMMI